MVHTIQLFNASACVLQHGLSLGVQEDWCLARTIYSFSLLRRNSYNILVLDGITVANGPQTKDHNMS